MILEHHNSRASGTATIDSFVFISIHNRDTICSYSVELHAVASRTARAHWRDTIIAETRGIVARGRFPERATCFARVRTRISRAAGLAGNAASFCGLGNCHGPVDFEVASTAATTRNRQALAILALQCN